MNGETQTVVVGDGPAGLSAGLLLAKKNETVSLFGENNTKMQQAHLYNYPGVRQLSGEEFIRVARHQCRYFGVEFYEQHVVSIDRVDELFRVTTAEGVEQTGNYLILAIGHFSAELISDLGVDIDDEGRVIVDDHSRTNIDRVYAAGVATRTDKIQATISVGQGASAALDIIDREQPGRPQDFDTKIE